MTINVVYRGFKLGITVSGGLIKPAKCTGFWQYDTDRYKVIYSFCQTLFLIKIYDENDLVKEIIRRVEPLPYDKDCEFVQQLKKTIDEMYEELMEMLRDEELEAERLKAILREAGFKIESVE